MNSVSSEDAANSRCRVVTATSVQNFHLSGNKEMLTQLKWKLSQLVYLSAYFM